MNPLIQETRTMASFKVLFWVCVALHVLSLDLGHADDFVDDLHDFTFIYHATHELLLTIYCNTCYLAHVPDSQKDLLNNNVTKLEVEQNVTHVILNMDYNRISESSLASMRDEYQDLLANFHCMHKHVYSLQIFATADTHVILDCDFESASEPWCGFSQDTDDDFNWTRLAGHTPSQHTGPSRDHTCGGDVHCGPGHYVYIEASHVTSDEKARLRSQVFTGQTLKDACLRFHYHMYGRGIGTLNVYIVNQTTLASLPAPVWTVTGNKGDTWREAEVDFNTQGDFQVIFEGTGSRGVYHMEGDIAIDDVTIFSGPCALHPASGQVRLVGGRTQSEGRVEVYVEGRWGTVCDDAFDVRDAVVVCRMLGYSESQPLVKPGGTYGQGSSPILLDDVDCVGNETQILDCDHSRLGNCYHSEDVGIACEADNQMVGRGLELMSSLDGSE